MGILNKDFNLFDLTEFSTDIFSKFPPLVVPYGDYTLSPESRILTFQKIKGIVTSRPLIVFNTEGNQKLGIITGEGVWRWRVNDFLSNGNYEQFDDLINKITQYLSLRVKKERFIVENKNVFPETDPVIFNAEVYNKSYELNNENDVSLNIYNEDGREFNYIFNEFNNSYRFDAGYFPAGNYSWSSKVTFDDEQFIKSGNFTILPVNIESATNTANHQVLYRLATENKGKLFYPDQFELLYKEINNDQTIIPVIHKQEKLMDVINLKWIFLIILIFMSVEWFMRKFYGGY